MLDGGRALHSIESCLPGIRCQDSGWSGIVFRLIIVDISFFELIRYLEL